MAGPFTTHRGGFVAIGDRLEIARPPPRRSEVAFQKDLPLVFLATDLPSRPSEGDTALRAAGPDAFFDAISILSGTGRGRLARYAHGSPFAGPLPGFWTEADLAARRT